MSSKTENSIKTPLLKKESAENASAGGQLDLEAGDDNSVSYGRILSLASEEVTVLIIATVALAFSSLSTVALPGFAGQLVDNITEGIKSEDSRDSSRKKVFTTLIQMVAIVCAGSMATFVRSYLFTAASERVVARLRRDLFRNLVNQEIGFFDVTRTGELLSRLSEDSQVIKNAATVNLSEALRSSATGSLALIFMFCTSWKLTCLTLTIVPPASVGIRYFGMYLRKLSQETQAASADATAAAEECLGSIRTVRGFAQEDSEAEKYASKVNETMRLGVEQALVTGIFSGGVSCLAFVCILSVLAYGALLAIDGVITVGALSSFVLYSTMVGFSFGTISGLYASVAKALGASRRVFHLLDRVPKMTPAGELTPAMTHPTGVCLADVWFAYPSRPSEWVLKGINLDLQAGSRVALVGPSGGGKTTIASLVQRLYDPQRGQILLSGVPLPAIDHKYLHSVVSIVSQEPTLFNRSIADNISYSVRGSTDLSEIERVAKLANAHEFISQFPDGYNTWVGERGVRLSGGQKQRIAIARALLTDPRILLLDEATSALDAESEHLVQDAMDRLMEGRTTLVIAHRLSTVKESNVVAVVHENKISEQGTHDELLRLNGVYANLVKRQLQGN